MVGAVLAGMVLTILLPDDLRPGPRWLLPLIAGLLLVGRRLHELEHKLEADIR